MPRSAAEIEAAAKAGDLPETPSFDAKADLPHPRRNADLAVDVAAMTTDGGVLLYGVAEDENNRPTLPSPIPLANTGDRVGQIVATSIAEVPYIDVREFPCQADPSKGYMVVVVPPSPRAPHQVTVGGDLRFYGRGARGNRRLTEGEVARLYERRQEWQINAEAVLGEVIANSEIPPQGASATCTPSRDRSHRIKACSSAQATPGGTPTRILRRGGALPWFHLGLDLAAVDRGAGPRRFRRVHRVEGALGCRHVVSRLEELDHDRGALVWVVRIWTPLAGMSTGGPSRASTSAKRPAR